MIFCDFGCWSVLNGECFAPPPSTRGNLGHSLFLREGVRSTLLQVNTLKSIDIIIYKPIPARQPTKTSKIMIFEKSSKLIQIHQKSFLCISNDSQTSLELFLIKCLQVVILKSLLSRLALGRLALDSNWIYVRLSNSVEHVQHPSSRETSASPIKRRERMQRLRSRS